jgi:hypothetical protein
MTKEVSIYELKKQFGSYFSIKLRKNAYYIEEKLGNIEQGHYSSSYLDLDKAKEALKEKETSLIKLKIDEFDKRCSNIAFKFLIQLVKLGFLKDKQIHSIFEDNEKAKKSLTEEIIPEVILLSGYVTLPKFYPKLDTVYFYVNFEEGKILQNGLNCIPVKVSRSEFYHDILNNSAQVAFSFSSEEKENFEVYLGTDGSNFGNSKFLKVSSNCYIYSKIEDVESDFQIITDTLRKTYYSNLNKLAQYLIRRYK